MTAYRQWLRGQGPVVEFEQLVKVFFAEHGTRDDLLATIDGVRTDLSERVARTTSIPHDYLEGHGDFPERLPWLLLVGRFLDEIDQAVDRWATWAAATVASWPDDITAAEPDRAALEELARRGDTIAARRTDPR